MPDRRFLQIELERGIAALQLDLPAEAIARLLDYLELLVRWNHAYNLTAVRDPAEMVTRHLLDSLAVLPCVRGNTLADLGSGAGLPGIPLAIAQPSLQVTLVDSNGKKVRFLREAVRTLPLRNVQVQHLRAEDLQGKFDCITTRALASLADMLDFGGHALADDGVWLALKGRIEPAELAGVPTGFRVMAVHELVVPGLAAQRQAIEIRRV